MITVGEVPCSSGMTIIEISAFELIKSHRGAIQFSDKSINRYFTKGRLMAGELLHISGGILETSQFILQLSSLIETPEKVTVTYSKSHDDHFGNHLGGEIFVSTLQQLVDVSEELAETQKKPRVLFLIDSGCLLKGFKVKKLEQIISTLCQCKVAVITNLDLLCDLASQRVRAFEDGSCGTMKNQLSSLRRLLLTRYQGGNPDSI